MPERKERVPAPWNWEKRDAADTAQRMRDLAIWVTWFVDRYHLAGRVPACWHRHAGLVDELKALFYEHQEVYWLVAAGVEGDFVQAAKAEVPAVSARLYRGWHEARRRWTVGALKDAAGYRECVAKNRHVEDEPHRQDASAFAEQASEGLEEAIRNGSLWR
jgi:hypothetical protein